MTGLRRAARRDLSEPLIVEALRASGFSVEYLNLKGCGDLLLGRNGLTRVVECKTGDGSLTPDQAKWWGAWRGNPLIVARTVEDALRLAASWGGDSPTRH